MALRRDLSLWRARRKIGADRFARFGVNSLIAPPATVITPEAVEVGDNVLFHPGAMLSTVTEHNGRTYTPRLAIGNGVNFGRGVWISCVGEIVIEDEVLAGHDILITDTYHEYEDPNVSIVRQPMGQPRPVRIGTGSILGPHVAVMAGVSIGARSFVAANAVVTKSSPANCVLVGNPARVLRHYDHDRAVWVDGPPAGHD